MPFPQLIDIYAYRMAILYEPLSGDHNPVGSVRAAEHQRGYRIMAT